MPLVLLLLGLLGWPGPRRSRVARLALALLATAAAYYPRLAGVIRFRQPLLGAILHPLGVLILLAIQWFAFARNALGRPSTWKGRPQPRPAARTGILAPRELEPTGQELIGRGPGFQPDG